MEGGGNGSISSNIFEKIRQEKMRQKQLRERRLKDNSVDGQCPSQKSEASGSHNDSSSTSQEEPQPRPDPYIVPQKLNRLHSAKTSHHRQPHYNTVHHVVDNEGKKHRRPLSPDKRGLGQGTRRSTSRNNQPMSILKTSKNDDGDDDSSQHSPEFYLPTSGGMPTGSADESQSVSMSSLRLDSQHDVSIPETATIGPPGVSSTASQDDDIETSRHSSASRSKTTTYDSKRAVDPSQYTKPETWVFVVACLMFLVTTAGLSCVILLVFGARGPQVTDAERLAKQVSYLSENPAVYDDPMTPQYQAVDWMVNADESKINFSVDKLRRETRFSLAVLYFSTAGANWDEKSFFLSKWHECDWHDEETGFGVECNGSGKLTSLTFVNNRLLGRLPKELSGLSDLEILRLRDNLLTGTIPDFTFTKLRELHLDLNRFEGALPSYLSKLSTLQVLNVTYNRFSSTLPPELAQLRDLESLDLAVNSFEGVLPLAFTTQLRRLDIADNSFTGSINGVEKYHNLEYLDISTNLFSGTIPPNIGGLSNLKSFKLAENQFEDRLPSTLGFMTRLQVLYASNNLLSGTFPWSFFPRSNNSLLEVVMARNSLVGSIPTSDVLIRFQNLEVIDLASNRLTGTMPVALGSLPKLRVVELSANALDGFLSFGSYGSLQTLSLAGNQLSGTIPGSLGRASNLQSLDLQSNVLSGTIPVELGQLSRLERIGLHGNNVSGNIEFLCSIDPMPRISADCGGLVPAVECSCCDRCFSR